MAETRTEPFFCGVIEGFYGQPWSFGQKQNLFTLLSTNNLNAYLYGPKDDDKHRSYWREKYTAEELADLHRLVQASQAKQIHFFYALAPGLDIKYSTPSETAAIIAKFQQLKEIGMTNFALFFDDIEEKMNEADRKAFDDSFAAAQAAVTNAVFQWVQAQGGTLLFCPTEYCGMMAKPDLATSPYLTTLGKQLHPMVHIMWTGPEIISAELSLDHIHLLSATLQRKPFIWDNFFANDYDIRRVYLGPLLGRSQALRQHLSGLLLNPNCEYLANFVPITTLGSWASSAPYEPTAAFTAATTQWHSFFETKFPTQPDKVVTLNDVQLLVDMFYTPYTHGERSQKLLSEFKQLLQWRLSQQALETNPVWASFKATTLQIMKLFEHLTYIKNRDLLYALYSYMWEMKEEVQLLQAFVEHLSTHTPDTPFFERFHKAKTFRGGLAADLQRSYEFNTTTSAVTLPAVLSGPANPSSYLEIKPFEPKYEKGVYDVCLKTGDSGADGTHLYPDDILVLGHRYIGPYVKMEPELAFVLVDTRDDSVVGYTAGCADTTAFYQRMEKEWFPHLRTLYPTAPDTATRSNWTPTQNLIWEFHNPNFFFPPMLKLFPAHLHIDIVAIAQSQGFGSKLMHRLMDAMRRKGIKAVHLGMSSVNHKAHRFYEKLGFVELARERDGVEITAEEPEEHTLILGRTL